MLRADARTAQAATEPLPDALTADHWKIPFRPLIRQGDLQTIAAHYWPRFLDTQRFPTAARFFETDADTTVLARLNLLAGEAPADRRPTVLAVHGLTACDRAPYMISSAQAALQAGFDAVRLNVRNCGGTEHLCRTLYHSGLTVDLRRVVEDLAPRPLYILGFSMGGNMALKLAGEWGPAAPEHVRAICAVSPPIQLAKCATRIGRPRNFVYEKRFLLQLSAALRRKTALMPDVFSETDLHSMRSIWDFDESVTAPAFGFRDASDYYRQCSSAAFVGHIRIPTLIIQARDDPFIPFDAFDLRSLHENPWLSFLAPQHGGHVAFLAKGKHRFWAQIQAMRFFGAVQP